MSDGIRQGIHFDLDTNALKKYYPKPSWPAAYEDIKVYLQKNGFEHEQGSGYHSVGLMTQAAAVDILDGMITAFPWLNKCVRVCTVADVPETFDIISMFDKNADVPERDGHERQSVMAIIREAKAAPKRPPAQGKPKHRNDLEH